MPNLTDLINLVSPETIAGTVEQFSPESFQMFPPTIIERNLPSLPILPTIPLETQTTEQIMPESYQMFPSAVQPGFSQVPLIGSEDWFQPSPSLKTPIQQQVQQAIEDRKNLMDILSTLTPEERAEVINQTLMQQQALSEAKRQAQEQAKKQVTMPAPRVSAPMIPKEEEAFLEVSRPQILASMFPPMPARPDYVGRLRAIAEKYFPTDLENILPKEKVIPEEGMPLLWKLARDFIYAMSGINPIEEKRKRDQLYFNYLDRVKQNLSKQGELEISALQHEYSEWKEKVDNRQKMLEIVSKIPGLTTMPDGTIRPEFLRAVMESYGMSPEEAANFIESRRRADGTIDLGLTTKEKLKIELDNIVRAYKELFPELEDLPNAAIIALIKKGELDPKDALLWRIQSEKDPEKLEKLISTYSILSGKSAANLVNIPMTIETIDTLARNGVIDENMARTFKTLAYLDPPKATEKLAEFLSKQYVPEKGKAPEGILHDVVLQRLYPGLKPEKVEEFYGTFYRDGIASIKDFENKELRIRSNIQREIEAIQRSNISEKEKEKAIEKLQETYRKELEKLEKEYNDKNRLVIYKKFGAQNFREFYDTIMREAINSITLQESHGEWKERVDKYGNSYRKAMAEPSSVRPGETRIPRPQNLQQAEDLFNLIKSGMSVLDIEKGFDERYRETKSSGFSRLSAEELKKEDILKTEESKFIKGLPKFLEGKTISYLPTFHTVASKYKVDPALAMAIAVVESELDPEAIGEAGEIGIMQVKPSTGKDMGFYPKDLKDPYKNIEAGTKYLQYLYDNLGDWEAAIQAYRIGPNAYKKGTRDREYLNRVKKWWKIFKDNENLLFAMWEKRGA